MMRLLRYCLGLMAMLCVCCDDNVVVSNKQQIVVEGWIEDGEFPVVIITKTLPVTTDFTYVSDMSDYIVRWARVVVSDGTDSVVLTGKYDENYFPPYIYTTSEMRGVSGRSYHLSVQAENFTTDASATIPPRAVVDNIKVEKSVMNDTLYNITASVSRQYPNRFFCFFVLESPVESCFSLSFLGTFTDQEIPKHDSRDFGVHHGFRFFNSPDDYTSGFSSGHTVYVKLSAMDSITYNFWHSYDKMISLSRNPMFHYDSNLPTNLTQGRGFWAGYGSVTIPVKIP